MSILEKVFKDDYEKVMRKLTKLVDEPLNQTDKMDKYEDMFNKYGLMPLDAGTNRVVYEHRKFPHVVFKIALDEQGTLDNGNENEKSDKHTFFPDSYDIDLDCNILVQERADKIDIDFFNKEKTRKRVREMLKELDDAGFLLIDLGSDKHKNFGYRKKNDDLMIIDFGYVEYKSLGNFNCPHVRYPAQNKKPKYCKGTLKYNKTFTRLVCNECDNPFKVDVVLEGYTETKHENQETSHKPTHFEPTSELKDFYKQFKGSRDKSTLTQYVALSRPKQNIEQDKGCDETVSKTQSTAKSKFLNKIKGNTGKMQQIKKNSGCEDKSNTIYASDEDDPDFDRPVVKDHSVAMAQEVIYPTIQQIVEDNKRASVEYIEFHEDCNNTCDHNNEVYESTESEVINVPMQDLLIPLKEAEKNNLFELLIQNRFNDAEEELRRRGVDQEEIDNLLESYYFERFPEMKRLIEDSKRNFEIEKLQFEKEKENCVDHKVEVNSNDINPIQIITETQAGDETHITIDLDNMNDKRPVVITFKGETVYYIDLVEHINRLDRDFVDKEKDSDIIITAMSCEPTTSFENDYDAYYYEN